VSRVLLTSLTRISPLAADRLSGTLELGDGFAAEAVARSRWTMGDYVLGRVCPDSPLSVPFELASGRLVEVGAGDLVIGALGDRAATLEAVGSYRDVADDGVLDALTPAGLLGRVTSRSDLIPELVRLDYVGHVCVDGRVLAMRDCIPTPPAVAFRLPVVLLIGSSMSAGKTTTGRVLVRLLRDSGRRVVAAKLTGAARYRDVLSLGDAGAEWIFDFVDAGLPSSICPPQEYREALSGLLARIASTPADVAVFEAGASPLEPYNGSTAIDMLSAHLSCMVLCASDPYAAAGIIAAFGRRPDVVAGPAVNTDAGVALVEKLTGVRALDTRAAGSAEALRQILSDRLARPPNGHFVQPDENPEVESSRRKELP
jgi:hypothetical protein